MVTVRRTKDGKFEVSFEVEADFDTDTVTQTFLTRDEVDFYLKALCGGYEQVRYLDYTTPQSDPEVKAFEIGLSRVFGVEGVTTQEWAIAQKARRALVESNTERAGNYDLGEIIRILRSARA